MCHLQDRRKGDYFENWALEFDFERSITGLWNGAVESQEGNHYVVKNAGYNANIDPTNPDTDGNGVLDGKEILFQTCRQEIDPSVKEGVTSVSVSLKCSGAIDHIVTIVNTYGLDMRSQMSSVCKIW